MNSSSSIYRKLARRYATCEMNRDDLQKRGIEICGGRKPKWVEAVAVDLANAFAETSRPRFREVADVLSAVAVLEHALRKGKESQQPVALDQLSEMPEMRPVPGAEHWSIPGAVDFSSLSAMLELHPDDLGWLVSKSGRVEHYHYRWHSKGPGRAPRLIEIPKPLLRTTQSLVQEKVLAPIPTHEASCGFEKGKSVFDFVRPHCGKPMVLKLDLKDFFPGIGCGRVTRLFLTAGYPEHVADWLSRLTTNQVREPKYFASGGRLSEQERIVFQKRHLPQGAPTSPALANLCAYRLDCRLSGLAGTAGISYTRYADDLLFSGEADFCRSSRSIFSKVMEIIVDSGFRVNLRKVRFMPASQRQFAAGLVLNECPNVKREEFDQLKAILHNCRKFGASSQNREAHPAFQEHLAGRIEWVAASNGERAAKLRKAFREIEW